MKIEIFPIPMQNRNVDLGLPDSYHIYEHKQQRVIEGTKIIGTVSKKIVLIFRQNSFNFASKLSGCECKHLCNISIGSMYGIFTYIYHTKTNLKCIGNQSKNGSSAIGICSSPSTDKILPSLKLTSFSPPKMDSLED